MPVSPPVTTRTARGSILLVTVLLALVAASIAYVAISGALSIEQQERERRGITSALRAAESLHRRISGELAVDPAAHLNRVLAGEHPRDCGPLGVTVPAGEPWPAACGTPWGYTLGTDGGTLLLPGDRTGEPLRIVSIIPTSRGDIALETRYDTGEVRPSLHLDTSTDLDSLSLTSPGGVISSSRDLTLSTLSLPAGTLLAAEGAVTAATTPGVTVASGATAREALGRRTAGAAGANHELVHRNACASLCIVPGGSIPDGETDILVPVDTRSVRLSPDGGELDIAFSPTALALEDPDDWQAAGSIPLPPLGLIRVDGDLLLEGCGERAGCAAYTRSFTVLAGSASSPARILLRGDLLAAGAHAGLSAYGDLHHLGGTADLSLNLVRGVLSGNGILRGTFTLASAPADSVTLARDPQAERRPSPMMPGISITPNRASSAVLPPDSTASLLDALPAAPTRSGIVPSAPIVLGSTVRTGGVDLQYEVGAPGAGPVQDLQYSVDSGETWTSAPYRDGTLRIAGLPGGASHQIRIRATNTAGPGPASGVVTVTVP